MDDEEVEPSGPDEELDDEEHDELHCESQRDWQSVVQLNCGGLVEHDVSHIEPQLVVQSLAADAVHCESHCCSSFAAQACSQLSGAHCVAQLDCVTSVQLALASMSMFPQADETFAEAVWVQARRGRTRPRAVDARRARGCEWLMLRAHCNC